MTAPKLYSRTRAVRGQWPRSPRPPPPHSACAGIIRYAAPAPPQTARAGRPPPLRHPRLDRSGRRAARFRSQRREETLAASTAAQPAAALPATRPRAGAKWPPGPGPSAERHGDGDGGRPAEPEGGRLRGNAQEAPAIGQPKPRPPAGPASPQRSLRAGGRGGEGACAVPAGRCRRAALGASVASGPWSGGRLPSGSRRP